MQAWKCMEDSIALSMLLKACQSLHTLESLVIHFTPVGTCHETVRNQAPRKDPFQDISRMYGPVWFHLQGLLRKSLSLRWVGCAPTSAPSMDASKACKCSAHPADKDIRVCNPASQLIAMLSGLLASLLLSCCRQVQRPFAFVIWELFLKYMCRFAEQILPPSCIEHMMQLKPCIAVVTNPQGLVSEHLVCLCTEGSLLHFVASTPGM